MNYLQINNAQKDILIVDDTPDNLRLLTSLLTKQGYQVRKALNGPMALTACKTRLPDLILLDIMMPGMDGYEVCQQLKSDPDSRYIPVIFLSALDDVLDKVKAFQVGGADFVTKPFQDEEILARVEHQLTIQELQRQLTEQNAQLRQFNDELKRANLELEQFTMVASHDLQSPLTAISLLTEMLEIKAQHSSDTEVNEYISEIRLLTANMGRFLKDLLNYSKLDNDELQFEPVDCNHVLEQVLNQLQMQIQSMAAQVTFDTLPTVMGRRSQLIQLFQNLIHNAMKFTQPQVLPVIKISAVQKEHEWIIGIHDNGVGIPSEEFDRIFQVFYRLYSTRHYPGNGMGLAICKKIIEQHGGRIWVESETNVGTTFYFTMPLI